MGMYGSGWKRAMSSHFLASPGNRKPSGEFQAIFQSLLNVSSYTGIFFSDTNFIIWKVFTLILFSGCYLIRFSSVFFYLSPVFLFLTQEVAAK